MQVACPSCSAEYPVDERRLPASGLKMRCPKCGARFHVHPDGRVDPADSGAASSGARFPKPGASKPGASRPGAPNPPAVNRPAVPKPPSGAFSDLPAPKSAQKPAQRKAPIAPDFGDGLDLPAPKSARKPPAPPVPPKRKPIAPPLGQGDLDLDLPAVSQRGAAKGAPGKPPAPELDLDLPAPKASKPKIAPPVPDLDLDLPAPVSSRGAAAKKPIAPPLGDLDLPAPRSASPGTASPRTASPRTPEKPSAPGGFDDGLDLPAPRRAAKPAEDDFELDLPAPRGQSPAASEPDEEIDLPARRGSDPRTAPTPAAPVPAAEPDIDLPARRAATRRDPLDDLDLPAPKAASGGGAFGDLDLPAPRQSAPRQEPKPALADDSRTPFDDLDLPVARDGGVDLPAAKGFGDVDLPRAKTRSVIEEADEAFGDLDLPMPKSVRPGGQDDGFGDLDLPTPKGSTDLPAAKGGGFGDLDLPTPKGSADLPVAKDDGFGDLDLPTPRSDLPMPKDDGFGDLDLPVPRGASDLPAPAESADLPVARGEADLPAVSGDFDELSLPEPRSLPPGPAPVDDAPGVGMEEGDVRDASGRTGLGGTAFGELDLGEGGDADDMEFADIPQEGGAAGEARDSLPPPRVVAQKKKDVSGPKAPRKNRGVLVAAALLGLLLAVGAGLGFTPYGYFGVYFFDRFMPGAGDPAQVRAAITSAEELAASDRWADVRRSMIALGRARSEAGLNRELLARSLVHHALFQLRFDDASDTGKASQIMARLQERGAMDGPEMALARAANLARTRNPAAGPALAQARAHDAADPYVDLLAGELALGNGDLGAALEAFERAAEHGGGTRALWGIARARLGMGDEGAAAAVDAVLEATPTHGEAMVRQARMRLEAGDAEAAMQLARQVTGHEPVGEERLWSSPGARAEAWTLIGSVQEQRGRLTQALAAYDQALEAHDAHVPALLGAGRVLLHDRPNDALVRFESVLQAEGAADGIVPSGRTAQQEAQLGAARAMLAADRVQEAKATLEGLAGAREDDGEVLLWLGRAEEALDPPNHEAAEQHYRAAIQAAPDGFAPYLALAELFLDTERGSDAGAVLAQASSRVDESADMRLALGRFEIRRNNLAAAIRELNRALQLDADLPPAIFALGVAHRRAGHLERAAETFERLARIDTSHPGLALERGLLFEARGESERAVASYREALEAAPNDMDLLLRLGAAQVAAGQTDEAEDTLERVRQSRPNSAEANHFMGRVQFARGQYTEALGPLRQAVRLDPSRGEFHLYVGWAGLEAGSLGEALTSVEDAIERDPSLGDAYWIRGEILLRSGRPRDALDDLVRALELKPSRTEIYAAMGQAHNELRNLAEAEAAYQQAVSRVDDNGEWWYRLGRLRMDRGNRGEAKLALARATLLGDATTPLPGWLADAHRLQADAIRLGGNRGERREAVQHYRRYLELAPAGAIDRADVRRTLMDLGEVPPPE